MSGKNKTAAPLEPEVKKYLEVHPEAAEVLKRMTEAQAAFLGFLRFAQPKIVLRELEGASTVDVDLNAAISRVNH